MKAAKQGLRAKEVFHLPVESTRAAYDIGPKKEFALQHPVYGKISDDP
jgi:hypothetical protein